MSYFNIIYSMIALATSLFILKTDNEDSRFTKFVALGCQYVLLAGVTKYHIFSRLSE